MKKCLLVLLSVFMLIPIANASHIIGGDINIQWVSANNYHIKLRAYRDDVNGINMPASITIGVYDMLTHVQVATQVLQKTNAFTLVPLGDPCYTPNPAIVRIEEGIFESPTNLIIANNPNGYYLQAQINARNSLAINVQTGGTMVWFATMPDPAIGPNSSPDFDDYPNDAYFCINSPKIWSYPITDADGDSLAYTLEEPLDAWTAANGTFAGSGPYPFYQPLSWQPTYNINNIVGGAPPMSIDTMTGVITAAPSVQGFFTFAIRVEEFRDVNLDGIKEKIGETRRDVQYISLNCTGGNPPQFLNLVPVNGQTIQVPYNKLYCKDLIFNDINATDTLYIEMISPIFDTTILGMDTAWQAWPTPDGNGDYHYYYNYNSGPPASWNDSVVIPPNQWDPIVGAEWNIGTVAQRFCWTPPCESIDSIYPFQVNAFSLGCDGKSQDSIVFNIQVIPPPTSLPLPADLNIPYGDKFCQDITFSDTSIVDVLKLTITSEIFAMGADFPSLPTNYLYGGFLNTGVGNGVPNQVSVGTQFCWRPDCEHIGGVFPVRAILSSVDCPSANSIKDTIIFNLTVTPPFDSLDVISNVFTPNGDGINDFYTFGYTNELGEQIGGVSNPCNDHLEVQIFNRWGILIYENENLTDPTFQWDGKNKSGNDVPAGTYFVLVHGIYGNEEVLLDQRTVTVLR